ncbi:MAG TPA: MFS transporter, partial [Acetobacteraceae bacterium]|nr:MFS transporter [Acetobacteraceae bacterium]
MVFCTATVMLASSALMAPYLETLAQYPVETAGWSLAPRGLGVMIGMQVASRLSHRIDHRKLMATGLLTMGSALYSISFWTPDVAQHVMMVTLMVQGFGTGLVFNPMTVVAFTTLPSHLRGYATSLQSLCRNLGQAVGVSVTSLMLVRNMQTSHAGIAAQITPFDRTLQGHDTVSRLLDPATRHGAALLDRLINHQAQIIAFNDDFRMMCFVVIPPLLLLLLMRRHERRPAPAPAPGE